jgi:Fe-S cluster biosynthesis and repair protein YggX
MKSNPVFQLLARWFAADLVTAAYLGLLDRPPDEAGLKAYCAELGRHKASNGKTFAELLSTLSRSQEHWSKSLEHRAEHVVRTAFKALIEREPEEHELKTYAVELKKKRDLGELLSAIGRSQGFWHKQVEQHAEELVRMCYQTLLGRDPDEASLRAYAAQLGEHKNIAALIRAIGSSQEHWEVLWRERAPELVRTVFVALLNREPEEAALKAYAAQIQKGKGLNELLSAIARSQEHWGLLVNENAKELITTIHRGLLRREPDDIGLTKYLAQLNASGDLAAVASAIGRSRDAKLKSDAGWRHPARSYHATTWVFLHVEKTAGTSLRNMITESFGVENIYQEHDDTLHLHCPAELSMFSVFAGHFNYDSVAFIPRRKLNLFTFVREPAQRLVSLYSFWRAHDPTAPEFHDSMRLARELDIETFYGCREIGRGQSTWNHMTWCIMGEREWRAWRRLMRRTAPEERRHVIETLRGPIRQRLREFCFVGLQEDFAGSCRELFRIMNRACPEERADHSVERLADINLHIRKMAKPALTSRAIEVMSELVSIDTIVYEEALSLYAERFPDARHPLAQGWLVPGAGRQDGGANHSRQRKARIRGR